MATAQWHTTIFNKEKFVYRIEPGSGDNSVPAASIAASALTDWKKNSVAAEKPWMMLRLQNWRDLKDLSPKTQSGSAA